MKYESLVALLTGGIIAVAIIVGVLTAGILAKIGMRLFMIGFNFIQ